MKKEIYTCDFCERTQEHVKHMVLGPNNACICDYCVGVAVEVIKEHEEKKMNADH